MAVLFLIFLDQIRPKWIKLDQIGFPRKSKNVTTKHCHISRKDKNGSFVFDFFWIRSVQNGSNLIKLDFLTNLKICHIYRKDKMAVLFLIFLDQICPNWIKLDQIGFSHQSKNVPIKICHIFRKDKNGCFVFDFFWIRSLQNGSNLIKVDFSPIWKCHYKNLSHLQKG